MFIVRNRYVAKWVKDYEYTRNALKKAEANHSPKSERVMLAKKCKHLKSIIKYGNNLWNNKVAHRNFCSSEYTGWTSQIKDAINNVEQILRTLDR